MNRDNENTPHFFLWGFDYNGEVFIDASVSIVEQSRSEMASLRILQLRQRFNAQLNSSMIWLPKGVSFEAIVSYAKMYNELGDKTVLKKLRDSATKVDDIIRVKEDNNAADFILHNEGDV